MTNLAIILYVVACSYLIWGIFFMLQVISFIKRAGIPFDAGMVARTAIIPVIWLPQRLLIMYYTKKYSTEE